jgi:hypothetical protein
LNDNDRETARAIGSLEASVKHLTTTWQLQDTEANEGRRRLYDKIEELTVSVAQLASRSDFSQLEAKVTGLSGRVDGLDARVTAVEPSATEWNNHQQQKIGTKKVVAIVWGIMLAGTSVMGGIIVKLFDIFWPPKH